MSNVDGRMTVERIKEILAKVRRVKVGVYGDFCLDAYWMFDRRGSEVSVETGLEGRAVGRHYYTLGGASNVVANLAALEPEAIMVVGVIGEDIFGRELVRQLKELGVDTSGLVVQKEGFDTVVFGKPHLEDEELPRIDFGFYNRWSQASDEALIAGLRKVLQTADVVIFNQQVPGGINNEWFIEQANALFEEFTEAIVLLDSRHYAEKFGNVYRKTNAVEAARLNGVRLGCEEVVPLAEVKGYAENLYKRSGRPVFVTRGSRGIVAADAGGVHEVAGIQLLKKLDAVGAGDTVVSALALGLAAGIGGAEAAELANLAAGVTVQKLFRTGTASGAEILELGRDPDYVYQAELAEDLGQANFLDDSQIELCYEPGAVEVGRIRHVVFDHDGTISTLRQGWEKIMAPVMVRAILGQSYDTAGQKLRQKVADRVSEYIDKSTGVQTIVQMQALVEMVREFGLVADEEVLEPLGYKQIYNQALMEMVSGRIERLKNGELEVGDFVLEGALGMLEALRERGVKLYLASGTDRADVVTEVTVLGYAGMFEGKIYGSLDDVRKYSKKLVISRIMDENNLEGPELAVFGDGPVELRECRKRGGIAAGVASDEVRRCGLNAEKRSRLIKAGAQIIVADFSEWQRLLGLLFGE